MGGQYNLTSKARQSTGEAKGVLSGQDRRESIIGRIILKSAMAVDGGIEMIASLMPALSCRVGGKKSLDFF